MADDWCMHMCWVQGGAGVLERESAGETEKKSIQRNAMNETNWISACYLLFFHLSLL